MNEQEEIATGFVQFTKSSSKDGAEGFTIRVPMNWTATDTMKIAKMLRLEALAAIQGKPLEEQLEESIDRRPTTTTPDFITK